MRILVTTFALLTALCASAWASDLTVYTEEYPPYNTMKDGELGGINTEKVVEMFEAAGMDTGRSDIKLVPWSRAYQSTLSNPNTCVYSTTRTAEREDMFTWVGPLSTTNTSLIAMKGESQQLGDISEAKGKRIGVVKDDVGQQLVVAQGIPESELDIASSSESNIKKLMKGRIDYFAYEVNALAEIAKTMDGVNPDDFESVYVLNEGELYLACHPETDPALIDALEKGYEATQ